MPPVHKIICSPSPSLSVSLCLTLSIRTARSQNGKTSFFIGFNICVARLPLLRRVHFLSAHMLIICYAVHRALESPFNEPANNSLNKPFFRFTFVFIASTLQIIACKVLEAFIFNTFCRTIYSQFDIRRLLLLPCYGLLSCCFSFLCSFSACVHTSNLSPKAHALTLSVALRTRLQ